jgi:tetratricopeptide (TPR) repeat protein
MKHILFTIALVISLSTTAQIDSKLDSLQNDLIIARDDSNKVKLFNNISSYLIDIEKYIPAMEYAQQAIHLSEKIKYESGNAQGLNYIGLANYKLGNFSDAVEYYMASLVLTDPLNNWGVAVCHLNIGNCYKELKQYENALKYYFNCLSIMRHIPGAQGQHGLGVSLNNIGNVYQLKGVNHKNIDSTNSYYARALKNFNDCIKIFSDIGYNEAIGQSYNNIGALLDAKKDYNNALINFHRALSYIKESKESIAGIHINLGNIYTKLNRLKEARIAVDSGLTIAKSIQSKFWIQHGYESAADLDSAEGNFIAALADYRMSALYKDSLVNGDEIRKSVLAEVHCENEQKETKDKLQEEIIIRKNNMQLLLLFIGIFNLWIIILWRKRKHKAKKTLRILGLMCYLFSFEYINLFLHSHIEHLGNGRPIYVFLIMVAVALALLPFHHKADKFLTKNDPLPVAVTDRS